MEWFGLTYDCEFVCFPLIFCRYLCSILKYLTESTYHEMENSYAHTPGILTPFNYIYWREDVNMTLRNKGWFRMTMGRGVERQQYFEKSKFPNQLDEAFGFMCIHICKEILFHLERLRSPKEVWDNIESLFGKHDALLLAIFWRMNLLQPNSFETI